MWHRRLSYFTRLAEGKENTQAMPHMQNTLTLLKVRVSRWLESVGVLHVGQGLGVLHAFCQPRQVAQHAVPRVCRGWRSTTRKKARLSKSLEWA